MIVARIALLVFTFASVYPALNAQRPAAIPLETQIRILRDEDTRNFDAKDFGALFKAEDANVRRRAALAAGRIGDERAVQPLIELMQNDRDADVRAMATFALGEIESDAAADALTSALFNRSATSDERARAAEALGKIAAALPKQSDARRKQIGASLLRTLDFEASKRSRADEHLILLGLTAILRAHPDNAGAVVAKFLRYSNERIREDAANTLARLRDKSANDTLRQLLVSDSDPIVRANAARALGATEDKQSFDALLDKALHDTDERVRVSCIRALGNLRLSDFKDNVAFNQLMYAVQASRVWTSPQVEKALKSNLIRVDFSEIIIAAANHYEPKGGYKGDPSFTDYPPTSSPSGAGLFAFGMFSKDPPIHIAAAKLNPIRYVDLMKRKYVQKDGAELTDDLFSDWRRTATVAQGLGAIAGLREEDYGASLRNVKVESEAIVRQILNDNRTSLIALSDVLRAYAAFKPGDLGEVLRAHLKSSDVIVRATAAELLGDLTGSAETTNALMAALSDELKRTERGEMNDAALAMLDALAKQKNAMANEAIKSALESKDHLIRRRAVALLKENGVGDFSARIGLVNTQFTDADYRRALSREGKDVRAIVETEKGSFTIQLLPDDAPLTVDNFISLARKGFFDGQLIPRVVPNFVVQAGDPRGDTNGGPGYQIRCEINEVPYERGAVGMALSGKDTGGSQWFVTHSPQPHLDGGYTVFGRVTSGMEVVDRIARGDKIIRVRIIEGAKRNRK